MKKYLCLIIISIWSWYNGYAQSLDGITLGCERWEAVADMPKYFGENTVNTENQLVYSDGNRFISLSFKDGRLYKIKKHDYVGGGRNLDNIKQNLEKEIIGLYEEWGDSYYSGENIYWKFKYAKASFSYDVSSTQIDDIANSYFDPYSYRTVIPKVTIYNCYANIELEFTADSFDVINNTKQSSSEYQSSGSGFVLSSNGVIVTNYHVVDKANGIDVLVSQNGNVITYKAEVLISDKTNDISLLKIKDNSFTRFATLPYAVNTRILDVGTRVFALGYPMSNILGEEIKLTDGLISSKTGYQGDIVTYQISAPIQPGNSGGPLFDQNGNIVGITNAGVPDAQNVGYAIKASYLRNLVDVAPETITLPTQNSISGLSFTEKIKRLTPYVVLIKVY